MKHTQPLFAAISAIAIVGSGASFAQCKPMEFAEMQTLNKDELVVLYCKSTKAAKYASKGYSDAADHAKKLSEIAMQYYQIRARRDGDETAAQSKAYWQKAEQFSADQNTCTTEAERVERLLKKLDVDMVTVACK